jgi:predicted nucleic acid-binding Zn finger protein
MASNQNITLPNGLKSVKCDLNDVYIIDKLEEYILEDLKNQYHKDKYISNDMLESLYFIYNKPLLEAFDQIDRFDTQYEQLRIQQKTDGQPTSLVTKLFSLNRDQPSDYFIYQVKGSTGINYYIPEEVNFCSCTSFKLNVIDKMDYLYCKHLIMIKILTAMNKMDSKYVKESDFFEYYKHIQ